MKIAYLSTLEEAVEVNRWLWERSRAMQRVRWKASVGVGILVGSVNYFLIDEHWPLRIALSGMVAVLLGVFCFVNYRWAMTKNIRKVCREQRGTSEPIPFCIEIDDRGVHSHLQGASFSAAWAKVVEIEDREGTVIFWMNSYNIAVARKRGFTSPEQCEEFIALARRFHSEAQDASRNSDGGS